MKRRDGWLLAAAIILIALPLLLWGNGADVFTGADSRAVALIAADHPAYRPWFSPLWRPPSAEIESLLWALQAGLGGGVLGYYLGFKRGQARRRRDKADDAGA